MKKHIKKKFLSEIHLTDEVMEVAKSAQVSTPIDKLPSLKKFPKDMNAFMITDTNVFFKTFPFKYQGAIRFVPEPDPVLVYFDAAYNNFRRIDEKKKAILKVLVQPTMTEPMINELYEFFSLASGFVIFLFTAIEAFMNRTIPSDYVFEKPSKRNTEVFTKRQIEEWMSFEDKAMVILPAVTKMNFRKNYELKWQRILNLKQYRDEIVHTKTSEDGNLTYEHLYKNAFEFKFRETIDAVADYINFYHEKGDYITECPCNGNW